MNAYQEHALNDGRKFWTLCFHGEVIAGKSWHETEVYSSAAQGFTTPQGITYGGGQKVSSRTTHMQEFWLRDVDGAERHFELTDSKIPLLEGHKITMVWGAVEGQQTAPYLILIQHTTGNVYTFDSNRNLDRTGLFAYNRFYRRSLLIASGLSTLVTGNLSTWEHPLLSKTCPITAGLFAIVLVYGFVMDVKRHLHWNREINGILDKLKTDITIWWAEGDKSPVAA